MRGIETNGPHAESRLGGDSFAHENRAKNTIFRKTPRVARIAVIKRRRSALGGNGSPHHVGDRMWISWFLQKCSGQCSLGESTPVDTGNQPIRAKKMTATHCGEAMRTLHKGGLGNSL
jgi:hypothetical protein